MHRLRLYARRNQLKFRATLIVFLALVIGVTGLIWGFVESEARQKNMKVALEVAATAKNIAEQKAYVATIGTAQAAIANESWGMARYHLASTNREQRGWEWHYFQSIVDQSLRTWLIGDRPTSLTSSPTGTHLAITFEGGRVVLIDETRDVTRDIMLPSKVNAVAFSLSGTQLVLGMGNGNISILDLVNDTMIFFDERRSSMESIVVLTSNSFATGHADGNIHIWNFDGEHLDSIQANRGMVLSLDYKPEQHLLAVGTIDGTVQLWELEGNTPVMRSHSHGGAVRAVEFLEDGTLVSGGDDGNIRIWDINSGVSKTILSKHGGVMDLSSIGDVVTSVGMDGVVRLWDANEYELLDTLRGHEDLVWSIEVLENNRFVSVGQDGSVRWWSAIPTLPTTHHVKSKMPASDIAFVWNDVLAAVSEFDSDMQVIDIVTGESQGINSNGAELTTVAFVPNTSLAVTGDLEGEVRLWDIEKLERGKLVGICGSQITALAVSTHGQKIVVGTLAGEVFVFDRKTRQQIFALEVSDSIILAVTFDSDGDEIYVSSVNKMITAIDVKTGNEVWHRAVKGNDIVSLNFIQKRNAIIAAASNNKLQLISAKDGAELETRETTGGALRDVALFQDGSRFVTALSNGTVGVWDTDSFNLVASIPAKQSLECISVSRDGYRLAIGGGNATIQLMDGMSRGARLINTANRQSE